MDIEENKSKAVIWVQLNLHGEEAAIAQVPGRGELSLRCVQG